MFKNLLITAGLLFSSLVSANATDVKRVTSFSTGSLVQDNQVILKEEMFGEYFQENTGTLGVSVPYEIPSDSYLVFTGTGLSTEDLRNYELQVLGVETGLVTVGSLVDYSEGKVVYRISYADPVNQYLYLSTNEGNDPLDQGQDYTRSKITQGKYFEKDVQFYLTSLHMQTWSVDITMSLSDVITPEGESLPVVYGHPITIVDMVTTLKPVVENEQLTFKSDTFDFSSIPQKRFELDITGIQEGFTLQVGEDTCTEDCTVVVFMSPSSVRDFILTTPTFHTGYNIEMIVTSNGISTEKVSVLSEGNNMNMYTIPYAYHAGSSYFTSINILSSLDSDVYFDLTVTSLGVGVNKETTTLSNIFLGNLEAGTMTNISLKTLLDIAEVEEGNYHATVTFKSEQTLVINSDNVSPNGRTTVNVEIDEIESDTAN